MTLSKREHGDYRWKNAPVLHAHLLSVGQNQSTKINKAQAKEKGKGSIVHLVVNDYTLLLFSCIGFYN